jgi:hypothetical protein
MGSSLTELVDSFALHLRAIAAQLGATFLYGCCRCRRCWPPTLFWRTAGSNSVAGVPTRSGEAEP